MNLLGIEVVEDANVPPGVMYLVVPRDVPISDYPKDWADMDNQARQDWTWRWMAAHGGIVHLRNLDVLRRFVESAGGLS